ncbi:MAG: hypothetical protein JW762_17190 [Dehalococcoidales bacterium]|nr:hypothetical protein [Dehalococcoidales bacterium]
MAQESKVKFSEEIGRLRDEITQRYSKTPEQLYEEREQRLRDAIELKEPDRVPIIIHPDPHDYAGIQHAAAYYDPATWVQTSKQLVLDFEPDICNAGMPNPGQVLEILDNKNRLWPGGPLPPDYEYQFVEREYMTADEYDLFITDPSGFVIRRYLPRVYGALQPLTKLPPMGAMFFGFEGLAGLFTRPEFVKFASDMYKAGERMNEFRKARGNVIEELALLGFPTFTQSGIAGGAPYDTISSFLRGMQGAMLDMYRRPDKLLQACDKVYDLWMLQATPPDPKKRGNPKRLGMPLWRGDKSFMSSEQFKKFYWPGLKKVMLGYIEMGYVPIPFFEAEFGERLECLLELPKGKAVISVEHMDVVKAKEILGGHLCVLGRGPKSLDLGSLQEAEAYYKNLIDVCGKDGGFVLNIGFPKKGSKEEIVAMLDSLREYARY